MFLSLALSSLIGSCALASGGIEKQIWNCKASSSNSYVSQLQVTVSEKQKSALGFLMDGTMTVEPVKLNLVKFGNEAGDLFKLVGGVAPGYDQREYSVQLIPRSADDFYEYSIGKKVKGQAVVIYSGFIDCLGEQSGAELLDCEVELQ